MAKNFNYDKIINNAIESDPYDWFVFVDEEIYNGPIISNAMFYDNEDFQKEGLPVALMFYYLLGKPVQEHEWAYEALNDLPLGDEKVYTTLFDVEVRNFNGYLKLGSIDRSFAREVIETYLRDELQYDNNQISDIIADLGLSVVVLKPRTPKGN